MATIFRSQVSLQSPSINSLKSYFIMYSLLSVLYSISQTCPQVLLGSKITLHSFPISTQNLFFTFDKKPICAFVLGLFKHLAHSYLNPDMNPSPTTISYVALRVKLLLSLSFFRKEEAKRTVVEPPPLPYQCLPLAWEGNIP